MSIRRRALLALCASAPALCAGCVERRVHIYSTPPGATVYLNDAEVGRTPCEVNFTYFGVYDVRLHREGCEPLVTTATTKAPFYEWPGFDLIAMAVPVTKRTDITWSFELQPADNQVDPLVARAVQMREESGK